VKLTKNKWQWNDWQISWSIFPTSPSEDKENLLLIHGFGASSEHWRHNQKVLGKFYNCYSIDLLGFGQSSQPIAQLEYERNNNNSVKYCFDLWGEQIFQFCKDVIKGEVVIVGNSIGGIVSLTSAKLLGSQCKGLILIDCAQRKMDDKRLKRNDILMNFLRPLIKTLVSKRFISNSLFDRAANKKVIKKILMKAYPSGENIDDELINILFEPSQRKNSKEAFRGFINLFDDYLATDLFDKISIPIHLIWGENDPWEDLLEAKNWENQYSSIKSLNVVKTAGHCPHDEKPAETNKIILKILQEIK